MFIFSILFMCLLNSVPEITAKPLKGAYLDTLYYNAKSPESTYFGRKFPTAQDLQILKEKVDVASTCIEEERESQLSIAFFYAIGVCCAVVAGCSIGVNINEINQNNISPDFWLKNALYSLAGAWAFHHGAKLDSIRDAQISELEKLHYLKEFLTKKMKEEKTKPIAVG